MNKVIIGIFIATIIILLAFTVYMAKYEIPALKNEIYELINAPTITDVRFLPGRTDTVIIRDTVKVSSPDVTGPVLVNFDSLKTVYYTDFKDSLLTGRITTTIGYSGELINNQLDYRFLVPIFTTSRVDTIYSEITRNIVSFKPSPRNRRFQFGIVLGGNTDGSPILGPSVSFLDRNDINYGYSYDVLQGYHLVTVKRTLRFR